MPLSRSASVALRSGLLGVCLFIGAPHPVDAAKSLVRHFPVNRWCSLVSGHTSPSDLKVPFTFRQPAGRTNVMLTFKAENEINGSQWNNQRLDDVVVLPVASLPPGTEPVCFDVALAGGPIDCVDNPGSAFCASRPPAFPGPSTPALFRDDFESGVKAEWGTVPDGTLTGDAPTAVFRSPEGVFGLKTSGLFEGFEHDEHPGAVPDTGPWQSAALPGATNLWQAHTTTCSPIAGARHLRFGPAASCTNVAGSPIGGTYTSPSITVTALSEINISFLHRWQFGPGSSWAVDISYDDGGTWEVVPLLESDPGTPVSAGTGPGGAVAETLFVSPLVLSGPFRFRFRFQSTTPDAWSGWQIDNIAVTADTPASVGGSLALGRSVRDVGGNPIGDADATATARLNLNGLVPGTDYAVVARWYGGDGNAAVPPTPPPGQLPATILPRLLINPVFDPVLTSPTHPPGVWSSAAQVTVQWSGAVPPDDDGLNDLAGYSVVFDQATTTVPDATVDRTHGADPHSITSSTLADGASHYFHLRTCDLDNNCTPGIHLGPFRVDRTAPTAPSNPNSTSHTVGVPSLEQTIDMAWSAASDALSGLDGYAFVFDNSPTWVCDQVKDVEESVLTTTSSALAGGNWYFHVCARDNAGNWSAATHAGPYTVADTTPPTNPTLSSLTHTVNVWSSTRIVTVRWSGSTDAGGSGLAGYSRVFDTAAATAPDTTIDTAHGADPHSFTTASLADGGNYYFHLRACDVAGNCSAAVHFGPFRIDGTAPPVPTNVGSTSHTVGVASADGTIDATWTASTDASSGMDGYAYAFDGSPTWTCDQSKDVEEAVTTVTSAALGSGTWYFHVCARDNAGNWSASATAGPYTVGSGSASRRLHTLAPCRLFDTRDASGAPPLGVAADRVFSATTAGCGVPGTAQALSVNVTVVSPTAPGHLTLYPAGSALPTTSTINYGVGQTRANNAILSLGPGAEFAVHSGQATGTVHLIVDVNGYFE